jgi:hypothetical protein
MSVSFPWQFEPPCAGSGLLHSWYRDLDPLPHVTEHEFQSCHVPQFPFTKYIKWNIIVFIIAIIIKFTSCRPHWKFAINHDFTVCEYFLKTKKHPHICRHCYPFRTYRTIQIWTVHMMILLLLHKLYTQNKRDLIFAYVNHVFHFTLYV